MPPLSLFALCAIGLVLRKRRPRVGWSLVLGSVATLVLLCVPWVAAGLLNSLQSEPALDLEHLDARARAIVVLGGDVNPYAPEFGGPTVGPLSLERVRYTAFLARATSLPVLVSGGITQKGAPSLAEMMKRALEREFKVDVRDAEGRRDHARLPGHPRLAHAARQGRVRSRRPRSRPRADRVPRLAEHGNRIVPALSAFTAREPVGAPRVDRPRLVRVRRILNADRRVAGV